VLGGGSSVSRTRFRYVALPRMLYAICHALFMTWQKAPTKQTKGNWEVQSQIVSEPELSDRPDRARRLMASLLVRQLSASFNGEQAAGGEVAGLDGGGAAKGGG
jgi:hypothetical protein